MKRIFYFCATVLISLSAQSQVTEPVKLTNEEIIATLVNGKSLKTQNTRWGSVTLQFKENGFVYANGNNFSTSGKWRVEDGKLCMDGRKFDYEWCGVVRKVGDEIQHLWPNGSVHFVYQP